MDRVISEAIDAMSRQGITGKDATPFLLAQPPSDQDKLHSLKSALMVPWAAPGGWLAWTSWRFHEHARFRRHQVTWDEFKADDGTLYRLPQWEAA